MTESSKTTLLSIAQVAGLLTLLLPLFYGIGYFYDLGYFSAYGFGNDSHHTPGGIYQYGVFYF